MPPYENSGREVMNRSSAWIGDFRDIRNRDPPFDMGGQDEAVRALTSLGGDDVFPYA